MIRALIAGLALLGTLVQTAGAQQPSVNFLRIGTGGVNGTYYPIGAIVGNAISNPPGSRSCEEGGSCGVKGLIALAVSSNGSVANVEAIARGDLDSGFAQADVVHDVYFASGAFKGKAPLQGLRVIANLYPETMQLVVRRGAGIGSIADLAGRRISLDEPGSGTLLMARLILQAHGLDEGQLIPEYMKPGPAATLMYRGEIDGFFIVAGIPTNAVADLIAGGIADLVSINGPATETILATHPFLSPAPIPAGTYADDAPAIRSIGVGAQWVVSDRIAEETVYAICRALWNDTTRTLLDGGHPTGRQIQLETALDGVVVPLHPGAERCYRDLGLEP